ncbi:MAG: hypothetical protein LBU34_10455, partial [Planctomycetaceae bacterium]|nr:hypothetical protein [Planctomycetaceae bacterium]
MKLKTQSEQRLEKKIATCEQQLIANKEKAQQKLDKATHELQATKSRLKLVEGQNRQLSQQLEHEQKNYKTQ